jgi:opacity protein-like surface antigen
VDITRLVRSACVVAAIGGAAPTAAVDLGSAPWRGSIKVDPTPIVEAEPRFYFGVRGGLAFARDTVTQLNPQDDVATAYDTGHFIGGMAGLHLRRLTGIRGLRADIEAGLRRADVDAHIDGARRSGGPNAFGRTDVTYGLVSLYYDFDTATLIRPFIGAGIGIAAVKFKNHSSIDFGFFVPLINDSSTALAHHLTAGLNVELSKSLTLEAAYRYFSTDGTDLTSAYGERSEINRGGLPAAFFLCVVRLGPLSTPALWARYTSSRWSSCRCARGGSRS